jgi:hypothetical protein
LIFRFCFLVSTLNLREIIINNHAQLKQRHRDVRESQTLNISLRIHRSLSWLKRAELADDLDGKFIFLWVSFNAAYATDIDANYRDSEKVTFGDFFKKLCDLDEDKKLASLVWSEFPKSIRILLDNPYINQDFWEFQRGNIDKETWQTRSAGAKKAANRSLSTHNTAESLSITFSRLYVLRNQLMHGGATWNSGINRDQIRDCVAFLEQFIPSMLHILIESKPTLWGDAYYPPIKD